jgi:hypothetical protein
MDNLKQKLSNLLNGLEGSVRSGALRTAVGLNVRQNPTIFGHALHDLGWKRNRAWSFYYKGDRKRKIIIFINPITGEAKAEYYDGPPNKPGPKNNPAEVQLKRGRWRRKGPPSRKAPKQGSDGKFIKT